MSIQSEIEKAVKIYRKGLTRFLLVELDGEDCKKYGKFCSSAQVKQGVFVHYEEKTTKQIKPDKEEK